MNYFGIRNCHSCPSFQFYTGVIDRYEDGILKKSCEYYCRYKKKARHLKKREARNGIPANCPRREKGVDLYFFRFTPELMTQPEDEKKGRWSYTFIYKHPKAPIETYFDPQVAQDYLLEQVEKKFEFQFNDILLAVSGFGTACWKNSLDGWEKRYYFNASCAKNAPREVMGNG